MPASTNQRPRSSGVRRRSNDRRQRSPTVVTKSIDGRFDLKWRSYSCSGIASLTSMQHQFNQCRQSCARRCRFRPKRTGREVAMGIQEIDVRETSAAAPEELWARLDKSSTWPTWTPIETFTLDRPAGEDGL